MKNTNNNFYISMLTNNNNPYCPFCFDGYIVKDNFGTMFCNACFKDVTIKLWDGKVGR